MRCYDQRADLLPVKSPVKVSGSIYLLSLRSWRAMKCTGRREIQCGLTFVSTALTEWRFITQGIRLIPFDC